MSVLGVGIDVVERDRIERACRQHGDRFLRRVLHECERRRLVTDPVDTEAVAEAFALKEAALKALGTGWAKGLAFSQVERAPEADRGRRVTVLRLHGAARRRADDMGVERVHASTWSSIDDSWAVVVLEGARVVSRSREGR